MAQPNEAQPENAQPDKARSSTDKFARVIAFMGLLTAIASSLWSFLSWQATVQKVAIVAMRQPEVSFGEEDRSFDARLNDTIRSTWKLDIFNLSASSPIVVQSVDYKGCNDEGACLVFHQPGAPAENYPDKIEPFLLKSGEHFEKTIHVYIPMSKPMIDALSKCKCQTYQDLTAYMLSQGSDELGNTLITYDPNSGINYGKPLYNLGVHFLVWTIDGSTPFEKMVGWKHPRFELDLPVPKSEHLWTLNVRINCMPGELPPRGRVCEYPDHIAAPAR
jgi:hypothetical protein